MKKIYEDCYLSFEENQLIIGNSCMERRIEFYDSAPVSVSIRGANGAIWSGGGKTAMFGIRDFEFDATMPTVNFGIKYFGKNRTAALSAELVYQGRQTEILQEFFVFPNTAAIGYRLFAKGKIDVQSERKSENNSAIEKEQCRQEQKLQIPEIGTVDALNFSNPHMTVEAVRLYDETDRNNELVLSEKRMLYTMFYEGLYGNIFIVEKRPSGEQLLIARDGYCTGKRFDSDFDFSVNLLQGARIHGNGGCGVFDEYVFLGGSTIVCSEDVSSDYRKFYKKLFGSCSFIMSNTWGDRHRDAAISEDFIRKEIDRAAELGVDIVQIDDGWQKGISANSALESGGAWGDFYAADFDFWAVHPQKFPNGFRVVSDYAKARGVQLGLWFSLDTTENYQAWERDADQLISLYQAYGIRYFKIDGLVIKNHICENHIRRFVQRLSEKSNGEIHLNFDITANRRFGYFMMKEYATVFMENRYTDWGNYYPHYTLRSLWSLCRFLPPCKFQFEVLNPLRNESIYGAEDFFRPSLYSIDYIFASVMVANPLMWMELSSLDKRQCEDLKTIIAVYRQERETMTQSEVIPIGEQPSGEGYTGFWIRSDDQNGYFIFLRELSEKNWYTYTVPLAEEIQMEVLCTNSSTARILQYENEITVQGMKKAGYLFCAYTMLNQYEKRDES